MLFLLIIISGRRDRDLMAVGFTTIYAISAYHHYSYEFESRSREMYSYNIIW
jgi:hypothetical protein